MNKDLQKTDVGIGVMIFKDGKVLGGVRKNAHGAGEWAFPGGHLEYMESFQDCAKRETKEEAGIEIKNIRFLSLGNITKFSPKHVVGVGLLADWESGEPVVCEPDKRESWDWYDIDNIKEPIFQPAQLMIDAYKNNKIYNDQEK